MELLHVIKRAIQEHNRYDRAVKLFRNRLDYGYDIEEALIETANETNVPPKIIFQIHEATEDAGSNGGWQQGYPETSGSGEPATGKSKKSKKFPKNKNDEPDDKVIIDNAREGKSTRSDKSMDDGGDDDEEEKDTGDDPKDGGEGKKKPSFKKAKKDDDGGVDDKDFEENEGKRTKDLSTFAANEKDAENRESTKDQKDDDDDIPVGKTVVLINPKEKPDFEDDDNDDDMKIPSRRK